jgi:site-specific recombinase XerD
LPTLPKFFPYAYEIQKVMDLMARRKGEGSLFRRGKIWSVAVSLDGRRYDKVLGTSNRTEAESRAKEFIQLLPSLGYQNATVKSVGLPLKDVWKKFSVKATCSPRTLDGYESNWKAFLLWAKQEGLENTLAIKQHHVDDFLEMLRRNKHQKRLPCKETTVRTLKVVKRVFKFIGHGDIWANARVPFHCVEKPKRTGFTEEELQTIQSAFDDPKIEMYAKPEMETIHHLALHTGLRLGD